MSDGLVDTEPYDQACVGYPDSINPDGSSPRVWFTQWFLQRGWCDAPAVTWQVDGNRVLKAYKAHYKRPSGNPNPPPRIYILTDEYDHFGRRLGVWPD